MLQRILTAIVGIPIVVGAVRLGGMYFAGLVLFLIVVGWQELKMIISKLGVNIGSPLPVVALYLVAWFYGIDYMPMMITVFFLGLFLQGLYNYKNEDWLPEVAYCFWGIVYVGLMLTHLLFLRQLHADTLINTFFGMLSKGEVYLWLVLLGTWASDTFAYFFGVRFGKRKLFPAVSPKKSWEGAIAGFIGAALSVAILGTGVFSLPLYLTIPMGLIVALFAPLGDLVESLLKRTVCVKDSGNIFPGHGGVLDRLDSLIFAVPLVYYWIRIWG